MPSSSSVAILSLPSEESHNAAIVADSSYSLDEHRQPMQGGPFPVDQPERPLLITCSCQPQYFLPRRYVGDRPEHAVVLVNLVQVIFHDLDTGRPTRVECFDKILCTCSVYVDDWCTLVHGRSDSLYA
jgi:hypothetical protein